MIGWGGMRDRQTGRQTDGGREKQGQKETEGEKARLANIFRNNNHTRSARGIDICSWLAVVG